MTDTRLTPSVLDRLRTLPRRQLAAILAALGLAGGGTYVYTRPDRPPPVTPPPTTGVLARVRIAPPSVGSHLIRVNVPVASAGTYTLQDRNGRALPTQTGIVTRAPNGGPRMVEVLALADTGPGEFALVAGASPDGPAQPADVDLGLRTVDHAGTTYAATDATSTLTRTGPVATTEERRGWLRSPMGATLLGYILAETQVAGADYILADLVVHNGPVPVAGDAYLRDLRVEIPTGYVVTHLLPHPWAGPDGTLIRANPDGTFHAMLQKQATEFRFAVHRPGDTRALAALRLEGFGVCVPGAGLWSPQNPATPWYFPQALPMPTLTANFDAYPYDMTLAGMQSALANGSALPAGQNAGAAGPYHPFGSSYGGVTGGNVIWQWDGLGALLTGRSDKLAEIMAYHRGITDRHRTAIFDSRGAVQRADALAPGWKVAATPALMWNGKEGPLNWKAANQWRYDAVAAMGKLPSYDSYLRGFESLDFQHLVRRTSASMALVWLCNDSIGRWTLELEAEWARMYALETGEGELAAAILKSQQYPGKGGNGGREHGWIRFAIAAQYQVSHDPRLLGWMQADLAHLERAQLPSGGWMALEWGKPADGFPNDAVSQSFENGICGGGVQACYGATGDARYLPLLRRMGDGLWAYHWKGGPITRRAVRPKDITLPAYTASTAPAPMVLDTDDWQTWAQVAAAMNAGSTEVEKCATAAFGADPLASMLSKPLFQLDNRAGLIGLYQSKGN